MTKVNQTTSSLRAVCLCGCISWSDGSEWGVEKGVRGWDCFIFVYFLPSLKISTDYSAVRRYSRLMDWRLMGFFFFCFLFFVFSFLFPLLLSRSFSFFLVCCFLFIFHRRPDGLVFTAPFSVISSSWWSVAPLNIVWCSTEPSNEYFLSLILFKCRSVRSLLKDPLLQLSNTLIMYYNIKISKL